MKWLDAEDIAIALCGKFPAIDPLTVRFTDLREKVIELDGFDDDPKVSNEPKLEAIQMAWYEEWKENRGDASASQLTCQSADRGDGWLMLPLTSAVQGKERERWMSAAAADLTDSARAAPVDRP